MYDQELANHADEKLAGLKNIRLSAVADLRISWRRAVSLRQLTVHLHHAATQADQAAWRCAADITARNRSCTGSAWNPPPARSLYF